ncbi:MAG: hypothetical protein MZU95_01200 [Desulfomicrobium escambiense]|nr:hypothetical protein [Desulfomicrobium escambiense]
MQFAGTPATTVVGAPGVHPGPGRASWPLARPGSRRGHRHRDHRHARSPVGACEVVGVDTLRGRPAGGGGR